MKIYTFYIKATSGRECVMRLPTDKYGGITAKGHKIIQQRFYDGATDTPGQMRLALNLEAFSTADNLIEALEKSKKNQI